MIPVIWKAQKDARWFCVSTKAKSGAWRDKFFKRTEFDTIDEYVEQNLDKDIYACPHGFSEKDRQKEYAVLPRLLWADLDAVNPRKLTDFRPTIAIRSSPGRYVGLWKTDEVVTELLNQRLTYDLGADKSGWPLTKVLRLLLDTPNHKYDDAPLVRLLWDDGPTYRVRDLERQLPKLVGMLGASQQRATSSLPPNVTPEEGRRVDREYNLGPLCLGRCGNRSGAVAKTVWRVAKQGGTAREAFAAVMISEAVEHYNGSRHRAWTDVLRLMSKHAAQQALNVE